jgi:HAD superfamily phosphatase (TIGR01668 family)
MRKFYPDLVVDSPLDVGLTFFTDHLIDTIFIDADNTLLAPGEVCCSDDLKNWICALKSHGIRVYLISNNTRRRIAMVLRDLDLEGLSFANKPLVYRIKGFMRKHNIDARHCCLIGDQLFTDILAAYRLNMTGILVKQISPRDYFYTRWIRRIERRILRKGVK